MYVSDGLTDVISAATRLTPVFGRNTAFWYPITGTLPFHAGSGIYLSGDAAPSGHIQMGSVVASHVVTV